MTEHRVEAEIPGIFYRKPSPDADVFVNEGDSVSPDDVVGLIEIMKSFNEVKAGVSGKVKNFHLDNEDEIEAGQIVVTIEVN